MKKRDLPKMLLIIVLTMIGSISIGAANYIYSDSCIARFYYYSNNGTVYFTDSSSTNAEVASWEWQFGDSASSNLQNPTHTYAAGIYKATVCLKVTTIHDSTCNICKEVIVRPSPDSCVANFNYEKIDSVPGYTRFHFTDASTATNNITSRSWSLSDSSHYSGTYFWHNFDTTLTYATVRLNISTSSGCNSSVTKTILLKDSVPDKCRAGFNAIYQPDTSLTGATYYFANTSSSDATSYKWVFGDGSSSVAKSPTHTYYLQPGSTVYVSLQIKTSSNCIDTFAQYITIPHSPFDSCFANFSYLKVDTGGVYQFTDLSSGTHNIVSRFWSLSDSTHYTGSTFTHMFPAGMSAATVCLTITTSSGCQSSICRTISFKPVCVAAFTYDSAQNGTIHFYNQSEVSAGTATWHWNFGDSATSTLFSPVHTYASNITKAYVCLSVKTATETCTACKEVIVRPVTDSCVANFVYEKLDMLDTFAYPTYRFTDASTAGSGIAWRQWSLPDSIHYTESTFTRSFDTTLTSVTVCLTIGTNSGCQSSICKTVILKDTIVPVNCHANFSYIFASDSMSSSTPGKKVYFYDQSYSTGTINYRLWDFGDGTYSQAQNPSHVYNFSHDTTLMVGLFIRSANGCADSILQYITIPGNSTLFSISGTVVGKNELLPQGIIVLYKKADNGLFMIEDANVISNGLFKFDQVSAGKYIIYAIPHMYYTTKYLPTYYVNKLHWANADIINLKSNAYGLKLQLVSVKFLDLGPCKIMGSVVYTGSPVVEKNALKSAASGAYPVVYLYSKSGAVITSVTTDESRTFSFENLPCGEYIIKVEYANYAGNDIPINLTPEASEKTDMQIVIDAGALSVKTISNDNKVTVYNVNAEQIVVSVSESGPYMFSLINATGRVLVNKQIYFEANTDNTISVGDMPAGVYMIKLQNNNGGTFIEKLMK